MIVASAVVYLSVGLLYAYLDRVFIYKELISSLNCLKFDMGCLGSRLPTRYSILYGCTIVLFEMLFWPYITYNILKKSRE